ncbi:MAG: baseplate J/gp47 family protein [Alphaproteobacteria bacterium]|nr:baseplate J/gp47 family protein [Alphaproteobacteria bacterium]
MAFSSLIYEDATGLHTPDYPSVLAYYIAATQAIFGADIYLGSDSQDGQYISIFALAAFDCCQISQSVYNSFSPLTAVGKALSTQVKINGIARDIATYSSVDLYLVGQIGTEITNGIAIDTLGQQWLLPASVVIPLSGDITVTATAQNAGNISAAANTVNTIFTPTLGWQTVNNPADSTPGAPVESDAALRIRQTLSVAQPALTVFESTVGFVAAVPGVTRFQGYENDTNVTDSNGIPPHTISIVAEGGDDVAIAQAIWDKKTPGTGTYGTTSEIIYDIYGIPDTIRFYRPTIATIGVNITIQALAGFASSTTTLIAQSVADYINSLSIGEDVYISRVYTPANLSGTPQGNTYDITVLELNYNGGPFSASNVDLNFIEAATCDATTNVTVTVI